MATQDPTFASERTLILPERFVSVGQELLMPTTIGTPEDDVIVGSTGADLIYGLGGNDILTGGLGADALYGGSGQNTFVYRSAGESSAGTGIDVI